MHFRGLVLLFVALAFTACKKYPGGPAFSLLTKKARVVNTWRVEQYLEDGVDKTDAYLAGYSDFALQFFKDGSYSRTWVSLSAPFTETGSWNFANDKEELVLTPASSHAQPEEYLIIKLKSRQLWLRSKNGSVEKETHYRKK
jgi:hypothetical protein